MIPTAVPVRVAVYQFQKRLEPEYKPLVETRTENSPVNSGDEIYQATLVK